MQRKKRKKKKKKTREGEWIRGGIRGFRGWMGLVCLLPGDATIVPATDRFQDKGCVAYRSWFDDFQTRTMMLIGVHQMMMLMMIGVSQMMMKMMTMMMLLMRKAKSMM